MYLDRDLITELSSWLFNNELPVTQALDDATLRPMLEAWKAAADTLDRDPQSGAGNALAKAQDEFRAAYADLLAKGGHDTFKQRLSTPLLPTDAPLSAYAGVLETALMVRHRLFVGFPTSTRSEMFVGAKDEEPRQRRRPRHG